MLPPVSDELLSPAISEALRLIEGFSLDDPDCLAEAPRVFAASPWLAGIVSRYPQRVQQALDEGWLTQASHPQPAALREMFESRLLQGLENSEDDTQDRSVMRIERHIAYLRILWRAHTTAAVLEETLGELSALAEAAVRVAQQRVRTRLATRYGLPRHPEGQEVPLIVIGMGKLGGCELNVSSDIDVIYVCTESEPGAVTDGAKPIAHAEWFARESRALTGLLSAVTADGFVFRVDTRLRPFGTSGPPVISLDALTAYWHEHARDWERHAMVKGRIICGPEEAEARFEGERIPFVFRPYLDFNAITSLRELKRLILASGEREDDLKLGRGGIRELEFLVQAYQLVRGGRRAALRSRSLLETLTALADARLIPADLVEALGLAYRYLRRAENAVQAIDDRQTHLLPADDMARQRVALAVGEPDVSSLLSALAQHRTQVSDAFDALFDGEGIGVDNEPEATEHEPIDGQLPKPSRITTSDMASSDMAASQIARLQATPGQRDHIELDAAVSALLDRPGVARLSDTAKKRAKAVASAGLAIAANCDDVTASHSEAAPLAQRWLDFVAASAGRGGYLQILLDRPGALDRVVHAFAASPWVAQCLIRQPILVDEMLRPGFEQPPSDRQSYATALSELTGSLDPDDLEAWMNRCRHFRHVHELRIALAWLAGELSIMQVSDGLSWLAEVLVESVLGWCTHSLALRHGLPRCIDDGGERAVSLVTIAYGKLGGLELAHGSDLDLVFLHDSRGEKQVSDGAKPIDNGLWHARLVQKFTHFMTTITELGALYEIDLRLRPNGSAGMLVTGFDAFASYQRDEAWTWEHQALLRTRAIYGNPDLVAGFQQLRREILCRSRPANDLSNAVADMRHRMYRAHGVNEDPQWLALKRDPGGITDIEFVVQYLVLAHASEHPSIVQFSDKVRLLEAASAVGVIDVSDSDSLVADWLRLRELAYGDALALGKGRVPLDQTLDHLLQRVIALRDRYLVPTEVSS